MADDLGLDMIAAFQGLHAIHQKFADAVPLVEKAAGHPICREACGLCCEHNTPQMTAIEAMNAISMLRPGRRTRLLSDAEAWLTERDPFLTIYDGIPTGVIGPKLRQEWRNVAYGRCPFLTGDKQCGLWQERPMACRAYNVTHDGDIGFCPMAVTRAADSRGVRAMWEEFRAIVREERPEWIKSGPAPTMLLRAGDEKRFRALVADNRIPSAKLIGVDVDTSLLWQPQLDALRGGVAPDLALLAW